MGNIIKPNRISETQNYKAVVSVYLPISQLEQIDDFMLRYRRKNKSETIGELITLALDIESRHGDVETFTSEDLKTLREKMEKNQLVDYFKDMDPIKFSMLIDIMRDEEQAKVRESKKQQRLQENRDRKAW